MTTFQLPPLLAENAAPLFHSAHAIGDLYHDHSGFWFLVLVVLVLINAFFVAAEISLLRVHTSQLEEAIEEKHSGAPLALRMTGSLDSYLAASQFGITLSSLVLGALGEPFLSSLLTPLLSSVGTDPVVIRWISFVIAILLLTTVHTVLGEQLPRTLGYRKTVRTVILCARPLQAFYLVALLPVKLIHLGSCWLLKQVFRLQPVDTRQMNTTAEELRLMVEESGRAQEVTPTELEILENALELNELCVRDILTPRNEVVVLDVHRTFKENLEIALESKHTRFPLVDGHLDQTLGLIHIKDLLREMQKDSPNLFAAKRDLLRVSELLPLDDLLKLFLSKRAHIALVVDEYGGSVGLVMLDDVLDQVVGEIHDEFDDEEESGFQRLDENTFLVQGWLPLHELADEVEDLVLEDPDVSTVGGFLTGVLGRIPEAGETISLDGYSATIMQADDRIVEEIHFEREIPEEVTEGEDLTEKDADS